MSYIKPSDIKSSLIKGIDITDYISEANNEIEDLAETLGVYNSSEIKRPVHNKVLRYGVVYILMRLCQDKIGTNDVQVDALEKYTIQYGMYKKELAQIKAEISKEMITGTVDNMGSRSVYSGVIFRA